MAKKRGLAANRGLDALLGSIKKEKDLHSMTVDDLAKKVSEPSVSDATSQTNSAKASQKQPEVMLVDSNKKAATKANKDGDNKDIEEVSLISIDVKRLQAGKYQPRRNMDDDALAELAKSIDQHGVMQPIVIRPLLSNEEKNSDTVTHEIIAGERRWRAAKMVGKATIPAIERALSDELAIALALIENIQREDLSIIEQASALQRFHTEFGMSHAMIADVVGKARTTVSNLLRLNQLHDTVKDHLNNKLLDMGHARALLALSAEQQPIIAQKIIDQDLTVRETEQLVKSIIKPSSKKSKTQVNTEREIEQINQKLSDKFGATVKLKQKKNGKGSVEIFFHSDEELVSLLAQLN